MDNKRLVNIINELKCVKKSLTTTYHRNKDVSSLTDYLMDLSTVNNCILTLHELCRKNNGKIR